MHLSLPLNLDAIHSTLATQALGHRIELRDQISSTNREAVALAHAGVEHGTVVVADSQTEGRGRLSRQWFSPPGVNLYCSIVIRKSIATDRLHEWLSWLPLMTALAAAESIETVAATNVAVKWPNDLLVAERKIGGILCESGTAIGFGPFQIIGFLHSSCMNLKHALKNLKPMDRSESPSPINTAAVRSGRPSGPR
jgi:BirA family biotin operon repressor/biotin-[acetyl-CoA-carboxylase] ligase